MGLRFGTSVLTDRGGRSENQDAADYRAFAGLTCWVLADGLGGHGGGETAARLAVETVLATVEAAPACTPETLARCLEAANTAVCDGQARDLALAEMRTTVVVLIADERQALWAHVGDTRLYSLSAGRIRFQTKDHSVPQAMSNAGEITPAQIRFHEDRNRLLRSLGNRENFRPAIHPAPQPLASGDAFLLATDGFWEYVNETEMEIEFAKAVTVEDWLKRMELRLRSRASGDHDNYSALAVIVDNSADSTGREGREQ